jgi:hypothetical protein
MIRNKSGRSLKEERKILLNLIRKRELRRQRAKLK